MSARSRQSTARPRSSVAPDATPRATAGRPRASLANAEPSYEPMQFPLSMKAQRALATLKQNNSLNQFEKFLKQSHECLSECAADVNERLYFQRADLEARKRRNVRRKHHATSTQDENDPDVGNDEDEEERVQGFEESLAGFGGKVKGLTDSMEEMTRKMIDCSQEVHWVRKAMEDAHTVSAQRIFESQQVRQSQRTRRHRGAGDDEEEDQDDTEMGQETQVTMPLSSRPQGPDGSSTAPAPNDTPLDLYRKSLQKSQTAYGSLSKFSRYAQNNDYIGFKRSVHEANYGPNEAPPVPPAKDWFAPSKGSPEPGNAEIDSDEEDFAVLREKISTKCPLSMVELKDPVTSRKCPHTFERSAITDFIQEGTQRTDSATQGRRAKGPKCCTCPVPGCVVQLTLADLQTDERVLRHIRKLQEHKRRLAEDAVSDDDDPDGAQRSGAIPIMSDAVDAGQNGDEMDIDEIERRTQTQVKREQSTARRSRSRRPQQRDEDDHEAED